MIKILGITTTYNVIDKIPYVMPYYERMGIDKLIVYDNYSTDNTVKELSKYNFVEIRYYKTESFNDWAILDIKNNVWKEYKNEYDWCIISDFDEVLYSRKNFKEVLKEKSKQGKTYLNKIGLNLLSREFPPINDKLIHENVKHGFIWDCDDEIPGVWGNKVLLFDIKNTDITYTEIGSHSCKITEETNKPFDDDISFFHIKLIDFNHVLNLSLTYNERIKKYGLNCYEKFITDLENIYQKSEKKCIDIDYYIDTDGKDLFPPILLILTDTNSLEDGKNKIDKLEKYIDKNIFYAIGMVTFNTSEEDYDYDKLFLYGKNKNLATFNGEGLNNLTINEWMLGYNYLFKDNFKYNNPWVTMYNDKILSKLSDPNLIKTLKESKHKEKTWFENIEITRFNKFTQEQRKTLGCYLIVKNEEKDIAVCLDNLSKVCDEIVVVDTGSNDKTIDIVKRYKNVKLEHFKWINDFSAARNYAKSKMTSDYIFSIDADELLTNQLIEHLNKLKKQNFNGVNSINMYIELDGNRFYLGGRQIVRNTPNVIWKYSVHEKLYYDETNDMLLSGLNEYIIHRPHTSTSHYNKYAETYYNELNKGDILKDYNSSHYFYYLFFTLNSIDNYMAKRYLYNCFDINKIKSNTENQGYNLWDCKWIDDDDYYLNSLIGGYKRKEMVLPYYNKLTNDTSKLICLEWCYEQDKNLSEIQYVNIAFLSYHYGLFNNFIKYTKELVEKYPYNEIGQHNIGFINNHINKLNNYNIIIDCTDGYECLPSTLHHMKQYFNDGFIIINDKEKINYLELLNYKIINTLPTNKKNIIIKANKQHERFNIKDIMQNLIYGNEPSYKDIFIK